MIGGILLALAIILALGLMIAGIVGMFSKRQRCWWKTGHRNSEALGSIMRRGFRPHFLYQCRDCGELWSEHW